MVRTRATGLVAVDRQHPLPHRRGQGQRIASRPERQAHERPEGGLGVRTIDFIQDPGIQRRVPHVPDHPDDLPRPVVEPQRQLPAERILVAEVAARPRPR